jgi:lipid-A-disaccharide synthase
MPPSSRPPRIFFVAGEVSGDLHGADLAREIRVLDADVRLEGIGGHRMQAAGVHLIEDSRDWAIMGWVDAARQLPRFVARLHDLTRRLLADPPAVVVPIDFPGFNVALLTRLRRRIPAVYYVPPMVSIRRGRRAERVAALGARLLPIFPFEADAYRRAGADVVFVGHPAADLTRDAGSADAARARLGLQPSGPVLGLLPGSRTAELDRLLGPMLAAARLVRSRQRDLQIVLGVASPFFRPRIEAAVAASGLRVAVADGAHDVMRAATVLLVASGTATVEAMVLGTPMVVVYRTAWLNMWIARMVVTTRWAAVPNIMAGEELVPELLQQRATPAAMAAAVAGLLDSPEARRTMRQGLWVLAERLGPAGAARRAASEVLAAAGSPALKVASAIQ